MKVTIAIRFCNPKLPTIAPSCTNVRQRFDRMGCYRLLKVTASTTTRSTTRRSGDQIGDQITPGNQIDDQIPTATKL